MAFTAKVEGLKSLEAALLQIEKLTTRKSLGRRVLKKAGQPIADGANARAPQGPTGKLGESYAVSTKLNKSQKRATRRERKDDVLMYIGTNDPGGLQQEFGNVNHSSQPHFRPAWDSGKRGVLDTIKAELASEIMKTAQRQARRKAKG